MAEADDVWASIADIARFAPTPHNTQPFRLRPRSPTRADLLLCCERLLPEEDHDNCYAGWAFGIFAETVERAGRIVGQRVAVEPAPRIDPSAFRKEAKLIRVGEAAIRGATAPAPTERACICDARRTS